MIGKEERKAEAARHNALMKGAFASETEATVAAARIYEDGEGRTLELGDPAFEATEVLVAGEFPAAALYSSAKGKTAVVSPTSFMRPGGNYEAGAFGPEQALCADSNLYQVLCGMKRAYHDANRGYACGQLFTDRAMYLPDVVFNRNGEIRKADVIAIPEPNRAHALENHRSEKECDECLTGRIEALLRIAAENGVETLVLGAFGCGRQGYEPSWVAGEFKAWVWAHQGAIARIVFAVSRMRLGAFSAAFGTAEVGRTPESKPAGENRDDEGFSLDGIDLPEGVALR